MEMQKETGSVRFFLQIKTQILGNSIAKQS